MPPPSRQARGKGPKARSKPARGRPRDPRVGEAALAATLELLLERGFAGLSMEAVARRAGVSKASLYRRHPGKGDLVFAAVFGRHFQVESQPDTGSLVGDLRAAVLQQVRVFDTPEAREALPGILAEFGREEGLRRRLRAWYGEQRQAFVPVLERAKARGELDPRVSIEALVDSIDGSLFFRAAMTGEPLDEGYAEALVALLLQGVRA